MRGDKTSYKHCLMSESIVMSGSGGVSLVPCVLSRYFNAIKTQIILDRK